MNDPIYIEQIRPELTWRLRRDILYPDEEIFEMKMEDDGDGYHFGAFKNNFIVAVVSLFKQGNDFQFRKFAVAENAQSQGIGSGLLDYIIEFSKAEGAKKIWCNARLTAVGFYLKCGFVQTGKLFSKNGFDYEIMEKFV